MTGIVSQIPPQGHPGFSLAPHERAHLPVRRQPLVLPDRITTGRTLVMEDGRIADLADRPHIVAPTFGWLARM